MVREIVMGQEPKEITWEDLPEDFRVYLVDIMRKEIEIYKRIN